MLPEQHQKNQEENLAAKEEATAVVAKCTANDQPTCSPLL